jgi:hypothetical protein
MTVVRAAAVQISPALYSREGTVDKVVQKIAARPSRCAVRDVPGGGGAVLPVLLVPAEPL